MKLDWHSVIDSLIDSPSDNARFLNTLSLLEYIGARKIIKSQREEFIDREVLAHMTEEIRHAQIFKKMALQLSDGKLETYAETHLIAGDMGRAYIQSIDHSIAAALGGQNSYYNYLLSTLLIEERANKIYPYFAERLAEFGMAGPLRALLREEEHHLKVISEKLDQAQILKPVQWAALRKIEEDSFNQWMLAIQRELDLRPLEGRSPIGSQGEMVEEFLGGLNQ